MVTEKGKIERALLTVPEACESLGVSRSKLYDLVSRGLIKTVKLSSGLKAGVRLRPEDLRDYAKKQAQTSRNIR